MGRPGGGVSGGSHSSGSHSMSRSSGIHSHSSGSSRPGSSISSRPSLHHSNSISRTVGAGTAGIGKKPKSAQSTIMTPPPRKQTVPHHLPPLESVPKRTPPPPRRTTVTFTPAPSVNPDPINRKTYIRANIIISIAIVLIILAAILGLLSSSDKVVSSRSREKLTDVPAYVSSCVVDELGWIESKYQTASGLKTFYTSTGVQPYVILKAYDSSITTEEEMVTWTEKFYADTFDQENVFLYIYFAAEDADNVMGNSTYVAGLRAGSIMDEEAVDIFWSYLDRYWDEDISMDSVIINTFVKTSSVIMERSKTTADLLFPIAIAIAVAVIGIVCVVIIATKRKAEREKAEETERILSAPVSPIADSAAEDIIEKYE